ncbi:hypothetical protein C7M84_016668 [Penaeus vannamei]|uniref:Uncharacterized protein n=1 Tax=Penaeus vannamei TaxID=6689 RepID=A0A3R7Q0E5_PENVA|nr:hypothetical protein C7M84_016668 [Penaeus vannamei]
MDEVHMVPYEVLLSYPSKEVPNLVRLVDQDGAATWVSAAKQKPLYSPEEAIPDVPFTFNGYAAPGNVTGAEWCTVNYGPGSRLSRNCPEEAKLTLRTGKSSPSPALAEEIFSGEYCEASNCEYQVSV